MKDWYRGRYANPFDSMTTEALQQAYADCKGSHSVFTRLRDEAEAKGNGLRAFVLQGERKRLAGICAEIKERIR